MYWIKSVPPTLPDLRPLAVKAIRKVCHEMTAHPWLTPWFGARGITLLAKRIRTWEDKLGPRQARLNLSQVIRMLEEIGTGGAGFRFMYAAFLQEAAQLTGIGELETFSRRMTEIGDLWREFAFKGSRLIKGRKGDEYTYAHLGDTLERIARLELSFFHELDALAAQAQTKQRQW